MSETGSDGAVHEAPPVTFAVWRAADGRTEVSGLLDAARAVDPTATTTQIWAALDALADAGLLESRAAPPASVGLDRRTAIRTLAVAAGSVLALLPRAGRSETPVVAAKKKLAPAREQDEKKMRVSEETHKGLLRGEEATKREISSITLKAKEEEEKLAPAIRTDPAAIRRREHSLKDQLAAPGGKSAEQVAKAEAIGEQMDKAK